MTCIHRILRPVVAHSVYGPGVFDNEKGNPLQFVYVNEVPAANGNGDGVNEKKRRVKLKFVTRGFFIVGDVEKEFLEPHSLIVRRNA